MKQAGRQLGSTLPGETHWHYRVYGQRLCSNLPLLEPARVDFNKRDIAFRCNSPDAGENLLCGDARLLTRGKTNFGYCLSLYDTNQGFLLRWEGQCDFLVSEGGRTIRCQPFPDTDFMWVRNILCSVVLSFALHVRGLSNFHASGVVLPEGAVGFLAAPGSGKSTLAAVLAAAGYPLITDDVLALQEEPEGSLAYPGLPYVSLSPSALDYVFGPGKGPSRISTNGEKQRVAINEQGMSFSPRPVPLKLLYILDSGDQCSTTRIQRLSRVKSISGLLKHTHCLPLLPAEILRGHLALAARLTSTIPVCRLSYPSGLERLPGVIDAVLDHQRALALRSSRA